MYSRDGVSHKLVGAVILFVAILIHLTLQLTYFKQVLPEIRKTARAISIESSRAPIRRTGARPCGTMEAVWCAI